MMVPLFVFPLSQSLFFELKKFQCLTEVEGKISQACYKKEERRKI